jgi:hypothetical protein
MKNVFSKPFNIHILEKMLPNLDTHYLNTSYEKIEDADLITNIYQNVDKFNESVDLAVFNLHKQLHAISGMLAYIDVTKQLKVKDIHKTLLQNITKVKTDISEIRAAI